MKQTARRFSRRALLASVFIGAPGFLIGCERPAAERRFRGTDLSLVHYGRGFSLPDFDGKLRTPADFRGKVIMLYFGFTQCPDACPTALGRAKVIGELLGENAKRWQLIFISLDPERDSAEMLREYMAAFDPHFLALRPPSLEEVNKVAAEFKIFYRKVPTGGSYTLDHSTQSYLLDPSGKLRVMLDYQLSPEDCVHDILTLQREQPLAT